MVVEYALKYIGNKPEVNISGPFLERSYTFNRKNGYTEWVTEVDKKALFKINPRMFAVVDERVGKTFEAGAPEERAGKWLEGMTKAELKTYALREFGVVLDGRTAKGELIQQIMRLKEDRRCGEGLEEGTNGVSESNVENLAEVSEGSVEEAPESDVAAVSGKGE